jgi:MoaA/NifB/PqqE/SkfB family radical SAM enzyme
MRNANPLCASPWLEAVVTMDGRVHPCCRSEIVLGRLGKQTLREVWQGAEAVRMRQQLARGEFPSPTCEACYRARAHTSMSDVLDELIAKAWHGLEGACEAGELDRLDVAREVARFHAGVKTNGPRATAVAANDFLAALERARQRRPREAVAWHLARLRTLALAALDLCHADPNPEIVGMMRQVSLVAVCNARCIHCVGLYNDDIVLGQQVGGKRQKRIDLPMLEAALECPQHALSFFLAGSEFFLYPGWRELLERFEAQGTEVAISTNGMLLSDDTIARLIASSSLRDLNISYDGASRETVESIRRNVKFDKLLDATRRLLEQRDAAGRGDVTVSLSMAMLARNRHEISDIVRLAHQLGAGLSRPPHVAYQVLDATPVPGYDEFRREEYTDIRDPQTRRELEAAHQAGEELGVTTMYSSQGRLGEQLAREAGATH